MLMIIRPKVTRFHLMSKFVGISFSFCSTLAVAAALAIAPASGVSAQQSFPMDPSPSAFDEPANPSKPFLLDRIAPGVLAEQGLLDDPAPDVVLTVRGGVKVSPAYFGSDELETGANGTLRVDYLRLPNGFEFGSNRTVGYRRGFGVQGSARYIGERNSSHHSDINGLDDVDMSIEAGFGLGYEERNYRVFADVRYGVIGHNAWVGEIGADGIAYPVEGLTLTFGPRVSLADERFTEAYFGVTESESARSGLESYDPDGGVVGVGVVLGARYLFNERWGIEGAARYDRLTDDASDSPITEAGSTDQYSFTVGLTRRISLDF